MQQKVKWFQDARFGMFIHWGAYSVAGRGEWVLNRENIPFEEYTELYVNYFTAEKYDPKEWAKLAKKAGMKYIILTTRHHDGFALWNTQTTDFNAVKMGPKKDLVKSFVEAVREEGLKVGLYYSVADWHHLDYPGAYCRDWPEGWKDEESYERFVSFYHSQLKELMTQYGSIDLLWYDGCIPKPTNGKEINEYIYTVQPNILINNRNGEPWDFQVCEQSIQPAEPGIPWEACMTLNQNWGYHSGDQKYKKPEDVAGLLLNTASKQGNLLLNVGPMADGSIPQKSIEILEVVGKWLKINGEGIYASERSSFSWNNTSILTVKGNRVYLYFLNDPGDSYCLAEVKNKVYSAYVLDSGEAINFRKDGTRIFLEKLRGKLNQPIASVIVLEVEGVPEPLFEQKNYWIV